MSLWIDEKIWGDKVNILLDGVPFSLRRWQVLKVVAGYVEASPAVALQTAQSFHANNQQVGEPHLEIPL